MLAWRLFRTTRPTPTMRRAGRALFLYSLSYLFVIFLALITDHAGRVFGVAVMAERRHGSTEAELKTPPPPLDRARPRARRRSSSSSTS